MTQVLLLMGHGAAASLCSILDLSLMDFRITTRRIKPMLWVVALHTFLAVKMPINYPALLALI